MHVWSAGRFDALVTTVGDMRDLLLVKSQHYVESEHEVKGQHDVESQRRSPPTRRGALGKRDGFNPKPPNLDTQL